jgi:hypothetical protein
VQNDATAAVLSKVRIEGYNPGTPHAVRLGIQRMRRKITEAFSAPPRQCGGGPSLPATFLK